MKVIITHTSIPTFSHCALPFLSCAVTSFPLYVVYIDHFKSFQVFMTTPTVLPSMVCSIGELLSLQWMYYPQLQKHYIHMFVKMPWKYSYITVHLQLLIYSQSKINVINAISTYFHRGTTAVQSWKIRLWMTNASFLASFFMLLSYRYLLMVIYSHICVNICWILINRNPPLSKTFILCCIALNNKLLSVKLIKFCSF